MHSWKQKLASFFYGRYLRMDELGVGLIVLALILAVLRLILSWLRLPRLLLNLLSLIPDVLVVWQLFRLLSKNLSGRMKENDWYKKKFGKILPFFTLQKNRIRDCKTSVYRTCPDCKAVLRLPRRKGKHSVRCPKCGKHFEVRVWF